MKILIIQPYPSGLAPGQRFRYEQYLTILKDNNYKISIKSFINLNGWNIYHKPGKILNKISTIFVGFIKRWFLMFTIYKYDVVFIFREASPLGPPIFEWIIAKLWKKPIVYDFDDAIWLPNYSEANAKFHRIKAYWKVPKIIKWATYISAGNEYLANYAKQYNPNVMVIPTTIDTENHHNILCDQTQKPLVIGWTGTHSTMQYLDFLEPILSQLEKKYTFEFHVISNKNPNLKIQSLKYIPWNKDSEIEDLAKIQIGVMPLTQDQWAEGKCGFKGLQYMALEIATVMSPVGVNNKIISNGQNGYLVETAEEWFQILEKLLTDDALRIQIGKAGKLTIENEYSVKANAPKYLAILEKAIEKK